MCALLSVLRCALTCVLLEIEHLRASENMRASVCARTRVRRVMREYSVTALIVFSLFRFRESMFSKMH